MAEYVTLTGLSGAPYVFQVCDPNLPFVPYAGNYAMASRGLLGWFVAYIGETNNLRDRLATHERWAEARSMGCRYILAHQTIGDSVRMAEEADLIAAYNPPLNRQLRTGGLAAALLGLSGPVAPTLR